jgi:hypothetical protein
MAEMISRVLQPDDLDPELAAIALPILRKYQVAALRVAANHANAQAHPLPAGRDTPEAILSQRFQLIAKARPSVAQASSVLALETLQNPKAVNRVSKALALNLGSEHSVDELVVANAFTPAPHPEALLRILDRHYSQLGLRRTAIGPSISQSVRLEVLRIVCIDETNGFLGSEFGEDEISMAVTTIDESGRTGKVDPFHVGDFDDNTRRDFTPPRPLWVHPVDASGVYPKHYFATMFLFEVDQGDLDETFEKLFRKFSEEVAAKIGALLGTAVGTAIGGPLGAAAGALIGWLVGWLMGKLVSFLVRAWEDDPFDPVNLEFIIPSATAHMSLDSQVFHFKGPGEYAVRYRWQVLNRPNETVHVHAAVPTDTQATTIEVQDHRTLT